MSELKLPSLSRLLLAAAALGMVTGCTSLTKSDEVRINKDIPLTAAEREALAPKPAPAAAALDNARGGAARPAAAKRPAAGAKKGGG